MTVIPSTITAELMRHADGRSIAYIDATAVAVFTYQQPDGTYVIDIRTRDDIECGGCVCCSTASPCPTLPAPALPAPPRTKPQPERSPSQGPPTTT